MSDRTVTIRLVADLPDSLLKLAAEEVVKRTNPYILACYYFTGKEYEKALVILEKFCLSGNSRVETAWSMSVSGSTFGKLKQWESAELRFQEAVKVDPHLAATYANWGNILADQGKTRDALSKYEMADRLDDKDPTYPFNMAATYFLDLHDTTNAERLTRKAIGIDPTFAPAHSLLGDILHARGKHQEAVDEYYQSVELSRGSGRFYNTWGSELLEIGDTASAAFAYAQAFRLDSLGDFHPLNNLGQIAFAHGNYSEAIKYFRLSIAAGKSNEYIYRRTSYTGEQSEDDHLLPAYFQIASASLKLGDTATAVTSFKWVALNRSDTRLGKIAAELIALLTKK